MARKSIDLKHVEQLQNGDMQAFEYIYNFYRKSVYFFSLSFVKNSYDAEEVVQETFIQMLNSIRGLQRVDSFHSWLHKIAYTKSMQVFKRRQKNSQSEEEYNLENIIQAGDNQVESYKNQELLEAVEKEINKMPTKLLAVAQLYYYDNFNIKEIATILEIPEGTVKTRLKGVRDKVQPSLKRKGFTPAKYFSIAFSPVLFKVFNILVNRAPMSNEATTQLYEKIAYTPSSTTTTATAVATVVGSGFFVGTGKIMIAAALLSGGIYGVSQMVLQSNSKEIKEIRYFDQMTNKNIRIQVGTEQVNEEEIQIRHNGKELPFQYKDEEVTFTVVKNSEYEIQIKSSNEKIRIDNIDKQAPILNEVVYEDGKLKVLMKDNQSGMDYQKTNLEYQGRTLNIPKTGMITGEFEGEMKIYLYDLAGNSAEYTVEIGK